MYSELEHINRLLFKPCGLDLIKVEVELEGKEYLAHRFKINEQEVKFRRAKITPTKTGQFVTLWKRNAKGITEPYNTDDSIDFCIILARKKNALGVFIFSKAALLEHGILSDKTKEGKRGFRVYPTWDITTSKQAQKTQAWQSYYFVELSEEKSIDKIKAMHLLELE